MPGAGERAAKAVGAAGETSRIESSDAWLCSVVPPTRLPGFLRDVIVVGVCGPSASGKGRLTYSDEPGADSLTCRLKCPFLPLCSDFWFKAHRDLPACPHEPPAAGNAKWRRDKCPEMPESQDLRSLCVALQHLVLQLGTAPPGLAPDVNVDMPRGRIAYPKAAFGALLSDEPVYVIVEGFVIFAEPDLVARCHHLFWLEMSCETGCRRRFHRQNKRWPQDTEPKFISFREIYTGHIHESHRRCRDRMLGNIRGREHVQIDAEQGADAILRAASSALRV